MKRNLKDRRPKSDIRTVADWETGRTANLRDGYWACACGSRQFQLLQHRENVKAECIKCGHSDIIYWNGTKDTFAGSMRRLDTNTWMVPKVIMTEKGA